MPHRKRVCFVDDEPRFLDGVRRMLRDETDVWDMRFAVSAQEALGAAQEDEFDAFVIDVMMPKKDGFELLAELRSEEGTKDVPVIILTASGDHELKRRALELGAADLLTKPVKREDLIARVRSVLRLKDYEDQLKEHNQTLETRVSERTLELQESRREIIWRLAKAGEFRDDQTGNHVARVGCYCRALAEGLGMDRGLTEAIFLTSPLHDIGKIGIPDEILLKPGRLEPTERKLMERHCAIGSGILMDAPKGMLQFLEWFGKGRRAWRPRPEDPLLRMASSIALTHHERWDGRGYPMGLAGDEIPLESRITGLADVYDALRSERPYKQAHSEETTVRVLREEAGRHFDPAVFAVFERAKDEFAAIRTRWSDEAPGSRAAAA